jgi:hypothetical protein
MVWGDFVPRQATRGETEAIVLRKLSVPAMLAAIVVSAGSAKPGVASTVLNRLQDQPSLGDVARQNRKDKEKSGTATPKTVVTDENLPSGNDLGGLGVNDLGEADAGGKPGSLEAGLAGLSRAETALNKLEPLDRESLAHLVLDGNTADFPNRSAWETRLFAAKQAYVSHSRDLIQQMRQLIATAQSLKAEQGGEGKMKPDDPRAQQVIRKSQQIMQDALRTESAFQAVVMEGQDLAKQGTTR